MKINVLKILALLCCTLAFKTFETLAFLSPKNKCMKHSFKFCIGTKVDENVNIISENIRTPISVGTGEKVSNNRDTTFSQLFSKSASIFSLIVDLLGLSPTAIDITNLCDRIELEERPIENKLMRLRRQALLISVLSKNRNEYIEIVKFLGNRIPRDELPNVQQIDYRLPAANSLQASPSDLSSLVPDCSLPNATFSESPLDSLLLSIFRGLVQEVTQIIANI